MIGRAPPPNVPVLRGSEEGESLEASWLPALFLLLGLGALPWKLELWIQVPPPLLDSQGRRGAQ